MLNLILFWLLKDADADGRKSIEHQLWLPPPGTVGVIKRGPWSREAEMAMFPASLGRLSEKGGGG